MLRRLGYVAIALSIDGATNRTCRLRNATPERLHDLIRLNLEGLQQVLQFNVRQRIFLYRISSQIIPFASHPINQFHWWHEHAGQLAKIADFVRGHGLRVSMHPGQYTVLNSLNPDVVAASVRELEWHVRFLDCLGTDASNKIVVHIGGTYGNKAEAADRFVEVARKLPEQWRHRLAIENDERSFCVQNVLDISLCTGFPVVFDWLHHKSNPGFGTTANLLKRCFKTWRPMDGIPKTHFSSQAIGKRIGQHADWPDVQEFEEFLQVVPEHDFDCMLEAKQKELALLRLRKDLGAHDVIEKSA